MGSTQSTPVSTASRCPVDHKNMTSDQINQTLNHYKTLGNKLPENANHPSTENHDERNPKDSDQQTEPSACPVDHKNMSKEQISAYLSKQPSPDQGGQSHSKKNTVYDVYGQELDRTNLMPATPNQLPSPGQNEPLSTDRVKSTIPKSGAPDTWTYPSPQMFYNALKRKGKADDMEESEVNAVVSVHNAMNERTWEEVKQWERKFHCSECENPQLKRFMGRPDDLSPAARFRTLFRGYPMPFDRHDWIVDRCGQGNVRYIIDYYYRETSDPIEIHVRPALDSFSALYDRIRWRLELVKETLLATGTDSRIAGESSQHAQSPEQALANVVSGKQLEKSEFDFLTSLTATDIKGIAEDVNNRCAKVGEAFRAAAGDPEKMEKANVSVNYCMAQRICKTQAADFMSALESGDDETEAYGRMTSCLERFHVMARRAILEEAGVVQSGPEFPAGARPSITPPKTPAPASGVE